MLESLTEKITGVLERLSGKARLTEETINEALREVRLALLEADVNFKVAKTFVARVKERCLTAEVLDALTPSQQVLTIVHEELTNILGAEGHDLETPNDSPGVIILAGLQGSGKTTTAAKLALQLRRDGKSALMVAADLQRPAAIDQLISLGRQLSVPVYSEPSDSDPVDVARNGLREARSQGVDWAIVDTAGRLNIDDELMGELSQIKKAVSPDDALLVVDSMTGQEAVSVAEEFNKRIGLTGLILTKMDGDARGGAALSVTSVTGVPIKFIGVGEKADALEPYHPDRLASRILGMGDVQTLVEKAKSSMDEARAREMERKMRNATFTLEDFLEQMHQLRDMGGLGQVLDMIPGIGKFKNRLGPGDIDDDKLKKTEAIILSMTPEERRNPQMIGGSRKRRICRGSGTMPQDVNQLLNQFRQMQKMMKAMAGSKPRMRGQQLAQLFR